MEARSRRERQLALEADAVEGLTEYWNRLLGGGNSPKFLKLYYKPLVRIIEREQMRHLSRAKVPKLKSHSLPLCLLKADKLATIVIRSAMNSLLFPDKEYQASQCEQRPAIRTLAAARSAGERCRLELFFDEARGRRPALRDWIRQTLEPRFRNDRHTLKTTTSRFVRNLRNDNNLGRYIHLGLCLVYLTTKVGLAEDQRTTLEDRRGTLKKVWALVLADKAYNLFRQLLQRACKDGVLLIERLPMVVQPISWHGLRGGGYLTNKLLLDKRERGTDLVKHWDNPLISDAVERAVLTQVLAAVNALQETRWRINRDVLRVMKDAWHEEPAHRRNALFGLPHPRPVVPSQSRRQREAARRANMKYRVYRHNIIPQVLSIGEQFRNEDLYFPYQLDFRGRAYPIPQILNPHSEDLARSLLRFGDSVPVGSGEGPYWMKVHLANLYGLDKESHADRVRWVDENEATIRGLAANPLDLAYRDWWLHADKRWCFLAACVEWSRFRESSSSPLFKTHLPVAMDGTCNGFQHLCAMGLDASGGKKVNLVPGDEDRPADVYAEVAACVVRRLIKRTGGSDADPDAGAWYAWLKQQARGLQRQTGKIPRSEAALRPIAKYVAMTTPYGVTAYGISRWMVREGFTARSARVGYMSELLQECISIVETTVKDIKDWMQKDVARVLANGPPQHGVRWVAPTGFPVVLEKRRKRVRIEHQHPGRPRPTEYIFYRHDKKARIDANEQVRGIVADFVHSFDAAHMMMTVNELRRQKILSFAMVHDSYGVHANHVAALNTVLRRCFMDIYSHNVLKELWSNERRRTQKPLKRPPRPGTLAIHKVMSSRYFFS